MHAFLAGNYAHRWLFYIESTCLDEWHDWNRSAKWRQRRWRFAIMMTGFINDPGPFIAFCYHKYADIMQASAWIHQSVVYIVSSAHNSRSIIGWSRPKSAFAYRRTKSFIFQHRRRSSSFVVQAEHSYAFKRPMASFVWARIRFASLVGAFEFASSDCKLSSHLSILQVSAWRIRAWRVVNFIDRGSLVE